jgi:hypothetical protein
LSARLTELPLGYTDLGDGRAVRDERLVARFPAGTVPPRAPPTGREAFRELVLSLLPERLPGLGGLPPEATLQARVVAECHAAIRNRGWAMMPFMIANGVTIPRRGATARERATDPLPAIIGARLKAMGVVPGVADLGFLLWPGSLAFLELKRPVAGQREMATAKGRLCVRAPRKGSRAEHQETFAALCRLAGWPCPTVDSFAGAMAAIEAWRP